MTVTEFWAKVGFVPYGSVVNSWDSFSPKGSVLMQLWQEPGQRVRDSKVPGAYLRVRAFDASHHATNGKTHAVGYAGRRKAMEAIGSGAKGYAALSAPPTNIHGPGIWAKHADLSRVYPVLAVEEPEVSGDRYVILGTPINAAEIQ